jgi:beta-lactam-binding protein with PASTA domain
VDTQVVDTLLGRVLDGRYRVDRRVARGGMATVYEGHDLRLDRTVAIKVMHAGLADDPGFVARFIREARSAARLSHPHVVGVHDQGSDGGVVFLVMEFVRGRTLRELLDQRVRLSPDDALAVLEPVLEALSAAHRAGFVHRDIKPENVLLADTGEVKVADFGLARAAASSQATDATRGLLMGTVAYLAPEQVEQAGAADPRSDVYATGIVLYELVTGVQPYAGDSPLAVAYQHVHGEVAAPSSRLAGIHPAVDALVLAATRRDPEERPADAARMLAAVRQVRQVLAANAPLDPGQTTVVDLRPDTTRAGDTLVVPWHSASADVVRAPQPLPVVVAEPPQAGQTYAGQTYAGQPRAETPNAETAVVHTGYAGPDEDAPVPGGHDDGPGPDLDRRGRARTPRSGRRWLLVAVGLIVLLAVVAGAGYGAWYLSSGRYVTIPGVLNLDAAAAQSKLHGSHLDTRSVEQFSETVPSGGVVSITPTAGERVKKGDDVTLVVSKGPERFVVPALPTLTLDAAKAALATNNLALGTVTEDWNEDVPAGSVISSDPAVNVAEKRGTPVDLVVSKGRQPISVPNVTGQTPDDAATSLQKLGLTLGSTTPAFSDTVKTGQIISQSSVKGSVLHRGDHVDVVVSKGPDLVTVPDITGKSSEDAQKLLEAQGFKVKVNKQFGGFFDLTRSADPAVGQQVKRGSTITITVL